MSRRFLIVDYETKSKANLKKVGAWEYSMHPSTRILCIAWRYGTREELKAQLKNKVKAKVWAPRFGMMPPELMRFVADPTIIKVAHNAGFEQAITCNVLPRYFHGGFEA